VVNEWNEVLTLAVLTATLLTPPGLFARWLTKTLITVRDNARQTDKDIAALRTALIEHMEREEKRLAVYEAAQAEKSTALATSISEVHKRVDTVLLAVIESRRQHGGHE